MAKTVYPRKVSQKWPVLPDPNEFVKRTSLTFSRRGEQTLKMDAAYAAFYDAVNTSPDAEYRTAQALFAEMAIYLGQSNGMWSKSERNKASKGLLADIHGQLFKNLGVLNPHQAALQKIDDEEIPHARFGVLYLLSNITVEIGAANIASIVLEGVTAAGSVAALSTTFNMQVNDPSALSQGNAVYSQTGQRMASYKVGMGELGPVDASDIIAASGVPTTIASKVVASDGTGPQTNLTLWQKIKKAITGLVDKLKAKMLADGDWHHSISGLIIKKLISAAIGKIFAASAPYVGAAMDTVTGVARTIQAASDKLGVYYLRKKFELRDGHPKELANSIESQMEWAIGGGIKDTLKGAAGICTQVFLPGAGSLVSAIMSTIEWLVKTIMRIAERCRIDAFLDEARKLFATEPRLGVGTDTFKAATKQSGGIVYDTARFSAFFRKGCKASPIIPMLTLNTGICGSLMTMIRMVNDHGETSQTSHDAGAEYFTRLKTWGGRYMRDSGFSFTPRARTDPPGASDAAKKAQKAAVDGVRGLLTHALQNHREVSTRVSHISAFMRG